MSDSRARHRADLWRLVAAACALALAFALFERPLEIAWGGGEIGGTSTLEKLGARIGFGGAARGFHVQLRSEPAGARVDIDGRTRGETPFFGNVPCREGEEVLIEISAKDFRPWTRKVICRENGTLEAEPRLER